MNLLNFNLPVIALLPFMAAPLAAYCGRYHRLAPAWVSGITTLLALALLWPVQSAVFSGQTLIQSWSWLPAIGLSFSFRLDGLAMLFSLLILLIGLLIIFYARYYLTAKDSTSRFYAYLLMFMGSMLGIVLSENILLLVVFWELTSLTSFLLISFWQYRQDARQGARMALTITGAGGLALLAAMLLIGHIAGSYQLTDVLAAAETIKADPLFVPALILFLLGVFTKSAQFPFHFWLPHAMAAPTPVSAYLHSATMVKAGIFLLARFFPVFSGTPEWIWLVGGAGMMTLLLGAYVALFKHDLKGLLAYSTLSHLGLITLLFGFSSEMALVAALFHIINHATFKGSLFMVAGIIDHESGTRDMRKLNGLFRMMPHTAVLAMIAAAAMAGVPLLNGFISKEMFFEQALSASGGDWTAWIVPLLVTLAAVFSVAYSLRFIHDVFFNGQPIDLPKTPHEPPRFMKIPVDILVVLCLVVGIAPMLLLGPILSVAAASSLQATAPAFSLAIWHGVNLPLMMSFIALLLGVLVYTQRHKLFAWHEATLLRIEGKNLFDWVMRKLIRMARQVTAAFDRSALQPAASWLIAAALFMGFMGFAQFPAPLLGDRELMAANVVTILLTLILIAASLLTAILHHQRLLSLITVGVVGLLVALSFVLFSAPDLALTQLSVEVVTIVLLLLALFFLPQHTPQERSFARYSRDGLISIFSGLAVFFLTMAVLSRDYQPISQFFLDNAKPGGGGTNVVNVILVDFRGFDTLGEVVVLALAGLGVYAMLQGLRLTAPGHDIAGIPWSHDPHPPIMQTLTRLLFPLMLMVAVFIFLRGHNLPGGGFIAGLIASVALISQYLANGIDWTNTRLRANMHHIIGAGLLIAFVTGFVPVLLDFPFLTTAFTYLHWPIVGTFEIASAIAFDLGVFLVVVGSAVMILVELGKLSHAAHFIQTKEAD
ncbi:Na(+) H(+) antiporter subunit A, Na(+) H(+) antiporter subunit B [Methylophaga frappieri]|uniref:Na(+) H(+) antiporter subunit A, Na(+) H(+) antiporter subunit B n=1 Tax=Methylophaga frappieri (strain ATCC BAA-2434 / DSM 25690 / JAM7) TaxID=754477 RepID=I1YH75_METFJ|nr:monovalent cation/H+ antiporter subunit A [Methylophaga frappieri]AFJ02268.1 Na(+) H(+) antiporter subunit A, Na(+) H(+) antiporter subunit B [Methylophaga frappieri]